MSGFRCSLRIFPFLLTFIILACNFLTGTPTPTPVPPTETSTATVTATPAGECDIVAASGAIAYTRPSTQSQEFADMANADLPTAVSARTADGWLGFEPAVAQAANIGVFRLRWVQASQVTTEGDCNNVPVVVGPPPDVCFTMPMQDTPVYVQPDSTSTAIATLTAGQYAAVLGTTASTDWAKLDLSIGNSGLNQQGWIEAQALNMNGPCDSLPVVAP